MERHFDEQLNELKHQLTKMCALAETMIGDAIKALVQRDASVLPLIQQHETEVNRLQVEIDEVCFTMIALHQPTASDLRFILGAAKTNTDLERLAAAYGTTVRDILSANGNRDVMRLRPGDPLYLPTPATPPPTSR